jgi:hypothetical protein
MVAAPPPSTTLKIPDSFFCGCKRSITAEGQAKEAVCQVFAKAREGGGKGDWVQESSRRLDSCKGIIPNKSKNNQHR